MRALLPRRDDHGPRGGGAVRLRCRRLESRKDPYPPLQVPPKPRGAKPGGVVGGAKLVGGIVLGLVVGLAAPFVMAAGASRAGGAAGPLWGLATCVAILCAFPYLWRRGMRGFPIGLVIGIALPMLLLVACASSML